MSENNHVHILKLPIKLLWKSHNILELVHSMVGLGTLDLQPITSEIELLFPFISQSGRLICSGEEENYKGLMKLDFFKLFRSYPPFEPLSVGSIYKDVAIRGDYVWFIQSKNIERYQELASNYETFAEICRNQLNEDIKCNEIICGSYKVVGDRIRINKLLIPRCISDGRTPWYKELVLNVEGRKVHIIYGYYYLVTKYKEVLERVLNEKGLNKSRSNRIPRPYQILDKQIIERLQQVLSEYKKPRYDVTSLDYVSWCYKGLELCTDPFSTKEVCKSCRNKQNIVCQKKIPGYGVYHYSRRIFPKVYTEIENIVNPSILNKMMPHYKVPITAFLIRGAIIESGANSFTLYLPGITSLCIIIEPDKKPVTPARTTNGLLVMIHEDIVNAFVDALTTSKCECSVGLNKPPVNLLDLLITKYILGGATCDAGSKLRFRIDTARGIISILSNNEDIADYIAANRSKIVKDMRFLRFVGLSIVHTLAHLLILNISSQFNLDLEDLLYVYGEAPIHPNVAQIQQMKYVYYAGIFENNDYGSIQLDEELQRSLFTIGEEIISMPRVYQIDLKSFAQFVGGIVTDVVNRYDKEILQLVKEIEDDTNVLIKKAPEIVYESIDKSDECMKNVDQALVEDIIGAFVDLLSKSVNYWRSKGVVLDQHTLSMIIQQMLEDLDKDITSYIANIVKGKHKELNKVGEGCVEDIVSEVLEEFLDKYLNELIFTIEPNYCLDGCNADIHLERYCTKAVKENYLTSRCLLVHFLGFIGINPGPQPIEFKVRGETLERIINAANSRVYIQTSYISTQGIHALVNLLTRNVHTKLVLDIRIKKENPLYVKDLEDLRSRFKNTFYYEFTQFPEHGKKIMVDNLVIHTSWNYGTGKEALQNYIAFIRADKT